MSGLEFGWIFLGISSNLHQVDIPQVNFLEFGWTWGGFGWGCIGGASPEIIDIYKLRKRKLEVENPWLYVIGSLGFSLLAGLLTAALLSPPDILAAFYCGCSMPVFVSALTGTPLQTPPAHNP